MYNNSSHNDIIITIMLTIINNGGNSSSTFHVCWGTYTKSGLQQTLLDIFCFTSKFTRMFVYIHSFIEMAR